LDKVFISTAVSTTIIGPAWSIYPKKAVKPKLNQEKSLPLPINQYRLRFLPNNRCFFGLMNIILLFIAIINLFLCCLNDVKEDGD